MALIQLRRKIFPNNTGLPGAAPFTAQVVYYDTDTRKLYRTQLDSQLNDPAELAKNAPVAQYQVAPGRSMNVFYNGNGSVYTRRGTTTSLNNVVAVLGLLPAYTSNQGAADACVDVTGSLGQPPYRVTLTGTSGAAQGYSQQQTSPSELFPTRFYNLAEGNYSVVVRDALNHVNVTSFTITAGIGYGRAALIYELSTPLITATYQWSYNARSVVYYQYGGKLSGTYSTPYGTLLDGYLVNNGATWRRVYSQGKTPADNTPAPNIVYFEDSSTAAESELALDNLILFHPDTPQEQNGGFLLEMRATHPPLAFTLRAGRAVVATNATGRFDGLGAMSYTVEVVDSLGKSVTVPIELLDRYGKHWVLNYSEVSGIPMRLELWTAGYTGAPEPIFGQEHPVIIKTDGLNGQLGGQGDIGPVVGTTAQLNLKITPEIFEEVIGRDRYCRADFYYDNRLYFRGFVDPSTYDAPLLPGLQPVSILATDGLGALKEIEMSGHTGQRLYGRRPWLNTILHALSRTDVALPLHLFTNRRDATMSDADAPEELATTDRTGYWQQSENKPWTLRKVLEAVAQALGGTLCQRGGTWQVRNILEAATDTEGRAYRPAGTPAGLLTVVAPTNTILPPTQGPLHWLGATQYGNVRAGWKSLTGKTDVGYLKNAYPQGAVFSDKNAWLDDTSKLRAVSGWRPAPGTTFPLIFSRLGEKGSDYTTQWLRSTAYSTRTSGQYLQGPALPLAPGTEAVEARLQLTGLFAAADFYTAADGSQVAAPTNAAKAVLPYELVVDGQSAGVQLAEFDLATSATAKPSVVTVPLLKLPSGAASMVLRLYSWYAADTKLLDNATTIIAPGLQVFKKGDVVKYDFRTGAFRLFVALVDTSLGQAGGAFLFNIWQPYFAELPATNAGHGTFYLSSAGVQLLPQGATWEGEDNFRADAVGTIRPTDPLEVIHPDVPLAAGLFGGNLPAFALGVALVDGTMSTSWKRSIDLDAAPLFESNVYDGLALRDGATRLLLGVLDHRGILPPLLLDTFDAPFEEAGVAAHRFAVCTTEWNTKLGRTEVSLVQNGPGAAAPNPYTQLSGNLRIADTLYQYLPGLFVPQARAADDGSIRTWA
jgi:hypothetical protein